MALDNTTRIGSIDYLLPAASLSSPPTESSPESFNSVDSSELDRHRQELIQLTRTFIEDGNKSRYIHHHDFAPEYRYSHAGWSSMALEEFISLHKNMKAIWPAYYVEPVHESVDIDLENRKATVWMYVEATGIPEGVTRQGLAVWKFRQDRRGKWLCYYHGAFGSCNELVSSDLERWMFNER